MLNNSTILQGAFDRKLFLDALNGIKTPRVPFWFMRQAGRYLPEYKALRAQKGSFLDMAYDPAAAIEVTMQPIRRFGMDAAIIFSDILVIPHALGQKLAFLEGEGPKLDALGADLSLSGLSFSGFERCLSPVYEIVAGVRNQLVKEGYHNTATIGFAGSPWTLACYMIEGGSSKEFIKVKSAAYGNPEGFSALIDLLCEAVSAYLIRQIESGAEAVQLFDSWSGVLDAQQFRKWVIEPTRSIVKTVRSVYPSIPVIGFPRGAGHNYLSYAQETGITAIGLDQFVPTKWAARTLQPLMPVQGNLDPVCLLTGGDALKIAAEAIVGDLKDGSFIFNLGHGIHKDTPIDHVEALIRMICEE